jgi:hypothetical protein
VLAGSQGRSAGRGQACRPAIDRLASAVPGTQCWIITATGDLDARVPVVVLLDAAGEAADVVQATLARLSPGWPGSAEQTVLELLLEPLACVAYDAAPLGAVPPTVEHGRR